MNRHTTRVLPPSNIKLVKSGRRLLLSSCGYIQRLQHTSTVPERQYEEVRFADTVSNILSPNL